MSNPVRRSVRLPDFDYTTTGAYFVTICAHNRACVFGDVVDRVVRLNGLGEIVQQTWDGLPNHFPRVELDQFVIMPNHVHAIVTLNEIDDVRPPHATSPIWINDDRGDVGAKQGSSASPASAFAPVPKQGKAGNALALPLHGTVAGSLCAVVQNFKSVTTRKINKIRHPPAHLVWQRNYYEHVIRDDRDLAAIRDYIAGNPARWLDDNDHLGRATAQSRNRENPLGFCAGLR
jgi:REP element-mobilizing transposase RayT